MTKIKFSNETLEILRNFSNIRQTFLFKPGNVLQVLSVDSSVLAKAVIDETIPTQAAEGKLSKFLGVLDLVGPDAEVEFNEGFFTIASSGIEMRRLYAHPQLVDDNYAVNLQISNETVAFELSEDSLKKIKQAYNHIRLNKNEGRVGFKAEAGNLYAYVFEQETYDEETQIIDGNMAKILVAETTYDVDELFVLRIENLNFISGDYAVILGDTMARFSNLAVDLHYWVALEN